MKKFIHKYPVFSAQTFLKLKQTNLVRIIY